MLIFLKKSFIYSSIITTIFFTFSTFPSVVDIQGQRPHIHLLVLLWKACTTFKHFFNRARIFSALTPTGTKFRFCITVSSEREVINPGFLVRSKPKTKNVLAFDPPGLGELLLAKLLPESLSRSLHFLSHFIAPR